MNNLLRKLKIIDNFTIELEIRKNDFVEKLKKHVDHGNNGLLSGTLEVFKSSSNDYIGEVDFERFKIRKRRKMFDTNMNLSTVEGTYWQNGNKLVIQMEVNAFEGKFKVMFMFIIIFYSFGLISILSINTDNGFPKLFFLMFLLIHMLLMIGIPFIVMRRSVKKMKHEIEREFFFIAKK